MSTPQALLSLLTELENELILLTLWSEHLPSAEALNSRQPFAYDTLKFEQWLQFIFIPRVTQMVQSDHPLPTEISLTPMAQMAYQDRLVECKALLLILSKIDHLMQGTEHA